MKEELIDRTRELIMLSKSIGKETLGEHVAGEIWKSAIKETMSYIDLINDLKRDTDNEAL